MILVWTVRDVLGLTALVVFVLPFFGFMLYVWAWSLLDAAKARIAKWRSR